jgi:hypothetical protein
MPGQFTCD